MKKLVFSKDQCGDLIPHWPEIVKSKYSKISGRNLRNSRYSFNKSGRVLVLDCCPILVDKSGFILNGKHRALYCHHFDFHPSAGIEACVVDNEDDVRNHVPVECYGEAGIAGVLEAMDHKVALIGLCESRGIYTIKDMLTFLEN